MLTQKWHAREMLAPEEILTPADVPVFSFVVSGRDWELDPLFSVGARKQKAAAKDAKFGAHFTRMYRFSAIRNISPRAY
jgi:hypothetical protein